MNKYVEVFAKQNPKFKITCKGCGKVFYENTSDVFQNNEFKAICPNCKATTTITDIDKTAQQIEQQLKSLGVKVV